MAEFNLARGKGWFRIWLVLSIVFWLYLTVALAVNYSAGEHFSKSDIQEIIGIYAIPLGAYVAAWMLVKAARWIRAGFREAE